MRRVPAIGRALALLVCASLVSSLAQAQAPSSESAVAPRKRNAVVVEDGAERPAEQRPAERPPERPAPRPAGERPGFDLELQFENGSARIRDEGRQLLAVVANALKAPGQQLSYFMIESYTDEMGHPARNLKLSQERAEAVRRVLIASGVPPTRLVAAGRGAGSPEDGGGAVQRRRIRVVNLD